MKGLLIAGGTGSRLLPATRAVNKHLMLVYDKPMIYYPLSLLIDAGIRNVQVISSPSALPRIAELLRDGSQWGIEISYAEQRCPNGPAEAVLVAAPFFGGGQVAVVLGDNLFTSHYGYSSVLASLRGHGIGATIFAVKVPDPREFAVVRFDGQGDVVALEEKPPNPESSFAVPGLYAYDEDLLEIAKSVRRSVRNELEITDINRAYLSAQKLKAVVLAEGTWTDLGTVRTLLAGANAVCEFQSKYSRLWGAPEIAALHQGFISVETVEESAESMQETPYGKLLSTILRNLQLD